MHFLRDALIPQMVEGVLKLCPAIDDLLQHGTVADSSAGTCSPSFLARSSRIRLQNYPIWGKECMGHGPWNVEQWTSGIGWKGRGEQLPNESKNEMARSRLAYSEFPARPAATRDRWPSVPARSRMRLEPTFARLGTKRAFFSCCLCKVPRRDYTSNIRCLQILAARKPYENALWPKSTERRQ